MTNIPLTDHHHQKIDPKLTFAKASKTFQGSATKIHVNSKTYGKVFEIKSNVWLWSPSLALSLVCCLRLPSDLLKQFSHIKSHASVERGREWNFSQKQT